MNIIVSANDGYINPLLTMLSSLFYYNKWCTITIHLAHSRISKSNLNRINRMIKEHGHKLIVYTVDVKIFQGIPVRHLSEETYYRLLTPYYLPKNITKALYLDADIIIRGSLQYLYQMDIENYYMAAIPDSQEDYFIQNFKRVHKMKEKKYVNAGVLLINTELLRSEIELIELIDYIKSNYKQLVYHDQDVINSLLNDRIKYIDKCYNYDTRFRSWNEVVKYIMLRLKEVVKKQDKIIHYQGPEKPWKKGYGGKYSGEFYKFAQNVPYDLGNIKIYNRFTWLYYVKKQMVK